MRTKISQIKYPSKGVKSLVGTEATIKGWVRTLREKKSFAFIEVNDGSTLSNFQIIGNPDLANYQQTIAHLSTGVSVVVTGTIVESPGEGQDLEMQAKQITIVGKCDPETYPLQKKRHSLEFLRTIAHLRPRTNTLGAIARIRSRLAYATHQFFQNKGFLYLQTPIITASDCEGAGELFRVTTLDPQHIPLDGRGKVDYEKDFFERPTYLTVSGQLNGEIFACALSDIYTFGPTFRAENSNTSRHLAEFWMVEPEMAFADLQDGMDNAEEYIKYIFNDIMNHCREDLEFFTKNVSKNLLKRMQLIIDTPFERASYTYAIRILEKSGKKFEYPVNWGSDLHSEHERYLTEEYFAKPVIITDFPKKIKPFYMRVNDDDKTVANMDMLVPKIGEVIGGSQREERLDVLTKRMDALGLNRDDYWWYLELREYGSVPHTGYGAGFERLVQFATATDNIRDAIAFPRYPGKAEF
ncbi:MAG: asparagine--tRNA ligase [Waddliaceae bacterium]